MERKKQEILTRLQKLNEVSFVKPTAMDLHGKRAMLRRVDRQESKRYMASVEELKAKLNVDLRRVESYLAGMKRRQDYLAGTPSVLTKPKSYPKLKKDGVGIQGENDYLESVRIRDAYLKKTPDVLTQPEVIVGRRPVLRKTRLPRYAQRNRRGRY